MVTSTSSGQGRSSSRWRSWGSWSSAIRPGAAHLAGHTDGRWLFPGKTAGEPVSSHGLGERLRPHGVTKEARISALHDLTRKIPSVILADLIGYNRFVVANRADTLAEPWQRYAAARVAARNADRGPQPTPRP